MRETVQLLQDFFSAMAESWKKLKTSNVLLSFIVRSNRKISALVHQLLTRLEWISPDNQMECPIIESQQSQL